MDAKNTKKATYMNHGLMLKAMLFQTYLDSASSFERKAEEARHKALDIQKAAVFRALHTVNNYKENKNKPASKGQSRTYMVRWIHSIT